MIRYDAMWWDIWYDIIWHDIYDIRYDIFLTVIGLTPGGSSTAHIYTQTVPNTPNGLYITIRTHKLNNKNT